MAFRLGILAAIVAYRRRNGKTRLKSLRQSLKSKKGRIELYEYPAKKLFSILFLISMMVGLEWIKHQIKLDLKNQPILDKELVSLNPNISNSFEENKSFANMTDSASREIEVPEKFRQQFTKIMYAIKIFHVLFAIAIFALVSSLEMKVVRVLKDEKAIMIKKYRILQKTQKQGFEVEKGDKLIIKEMGESRLTKTDYYFSVRLIGQKGSRHIIRKSCIFDARVAVIKLAHELEINFSTKIRKQGKSKKHEEDDQQC